ncbi:MAG TPA: ATP-binding protein [Pirellulales bacterium]|jgi:signal transduction histidine kinase/CheY-like chemotaxis protein|nr:ATP-binding protein [Pirellulales bacterium]
MSLKQRTDRAQDASKNVGVVDWLGATYPPEIQDRFRLVLNKVPVVLFTHDDQLRFTSIHNPLGQIPTGSIIGKTDLELAEIYAPEAAAELVEFKSEVLRTGRGARRTFFLSIFGNPCAFDLTAEPIRDADGRLVGLACAAIDVTEQQRAERALREANRQKDEFLAMLAHELRNPLAPIRGAVQLLQLFGSNVPDKGLAIEVIDRQVDMLARLVDDLLDVSRITRGKITVRREPVELSTAIQRAIDTTLPMIHSRGQTLSVSHSNEPLSISGDAARIEQVFCNLLNNAAKFMGAGGRIEVQCERVDAEAIVRVRDQGRGLAAESIPRLFESFYQVDQGLARSEGGLGLGLALAKRLVELHGGSIEALSEGLGRGSEFVVRLPLAVWPESSESPAGVPSGAARCAGGLRILIVDDSADAVTTLKLLLAVRGHEICTAGDGAEALTAFNDFDPQVVLLDIGLPGMDGYEIAKRIRQSANGEQVRIIATTGYGRDEDRHRAMEAGFDFHLTKPVNFKTLEELINGIRVS